MSLLLAAALPCALTGEALAHPSPAEPPAFFSDDCIEVVDRQRSPVWHLDYAVLADDTAPEVDHVSLPDSKTHQFFAVSGTVYERTMEHVVLPWTDPLGEPLRLPSWLSHADVQRTEDGAREDDMIDFTAEQVETADVLEDRPELAALLRPLSPGTLRVPITEGQAAAGADWSLTDVPAGAYQIAGYIFSPPYNGWAVRPGVVVVEDGPSEAHPALTAQPVAGRVFAGQGRRVRGCVRAPPGSELQLLTRPDGGRAFTPTGAPTTVDDTTYDICLPNPGRDALLEVRVELRGPDGLLAATHATGQLTFFTAAAACRPDALTCCPDPHDDATPSSPQATADAGATADMDPGPGPAPAMDVDAAIANVAPTVERDAQHDDAPRDDSPEQAGPRADAGCAVRPLASPPADAGPIVWIVLSLTLTRRRARRRSADFA